MANLTIRAEGDPVLTASDVESEEDESSSAEEHGMICDIEDADISSGFRETKEREIAAQLSSRLFVARRSQKRRW